MNVDIEKVLEIKRQLKEINDMDLSDINWYSKGKPVIVYKNEIEEWKYVGLNNTDFMEFVLESK